MRGTWEIYLVSAGLCDAQHETWVCKIRSTPLLTCEAEEIAADSSHQTEVHRKDSLVGVFRLATLGAKARPSLAIVR